jgi:serine/threonine protein kinase
MEFVTAAEAIPEAVVDVRVVDFSRMPVLSTIGEGPHGLVRLVEFTDEDHVEQLAAKFHTRNTELIPSQDPCKEIVAAFASVNCPFLATIKYYQPPTEEFGPVIATDFFRLHSLSSLLRAVATGEEQQKWTVDRKIILLGGLIRAVKALHDANLFHGDLNPSNVLLREDSSPCITDCLTYSFVGMAVMDPQSLGSSSYTAPDLGRLSEATFDFRNAPLVAGLQKVDIYALGLIMYEILTGQPVFPPSLGLLQLMKLSRSKTRPAIPDSVNGEFAALIRRSWDTVPEMRPTIADVWDCFDRIQYAVIQGVNASAVAQVIGLARRAAAAGDKDSLDKDGPSDQVPSTSTGPSLER